MRRRIVLKAMAAAVLAPLAVVRGQALSSGITSYKRLWEAREQERAEHDEMRRDAIWLRKVDGLAVLDARGRVCYHFWVT
jgi:hypothetical protein